MIFKHCDAIRTCDKITRKSKSSLQTFGLWTTIRLWPFDNYRVSKQVWNYKLKFYELSSIAQSPKPKHTGTLCICALSKHLSKSLQGQRLKKAINLQRIRRIVRILDTTDTAANTLFSRKDYSAFETLKKSISESPLRIFRKPFQTAHYESNSALQNITHCGKNVILFKKSFHAQNFVILGVQQVLKSQRRKKSWNFVYYLAKQCKSPFILTKRIQNSKLAQFEISIFNRKKKFGKIFFANCFQIFLLQIFWGRKTFPKFFS